MANRKEWERYTESSLTRGEMDERGLLFISPLGQVDLSRVALLSAAVDTVRQKFEGMPHPEKVQEVQTAYEAGHKQLVQVLGCDFVLGSGGQSGYRYRLQNNEMGLIILFGSRYKELDKEYSHLKLELSPHLIASASPKETQAFMNQVAAEFIRLPRACGVAVHLAVDIQGWELPEDFESRFVARSRRKARFDGLSEFDFSTVTVMYGERETFMYGTASALQFSLYRKDLEARKRDKIHYWESVWRQSTDASSFPETNYHPTAPVWRAEARFHDSVVSEFAEGLGVHLEDFEAISAHLTGLWRYALGSYRLDASRTYVDPFWQLLMTDVEFYAPAPDLLYKRVRKTPGVGNEKNVALALGNLLSIYARNGFKLPQVMQYLRSSGMWNDLLNYCHERQVSPNEFEQMIGKGLALRRLVGRAA